MAQHNIPLAYEASEGVSDTMKVTPELPSEVVQCLNNARFLHLATCNNNIPHVSLMNYSYLPHTPWDDSPVVIMTTNPASKKYHNIMANPNVSLLVHDWVSHRPSTSAQRRMSAGGSPGPEVRSTLAEMLFNLNSSAVSSISATIGGKARVIEPGSETEKYYRDVHIENHRFGTEASTGTVAPAQQGDGGRQCFVEGEAVCVIVVRIHEVRIADWKGNVTDWGISANDTRTVEASGGGPVVNGNAD
ncbi:hypothetical protein V8F33_001098 [Rhypophila sp. PSN 637]